jgi:hypothetical protein
MLKIRITSFILFFIFSAALSTCITYSQEQTEIDSLITGKKYRITLYNDKEVIGKVARQDSIYAYIITETATVRIKKDEIFSISGSTVPNIMSAMITLGGGILLESGNYNGYDRSSSPGYSVQFTAVAPFTENNAIRFDLGFGQIKRDVFSYAYGYEYNTSDVKQTRSIYIANCDYVFGNFANSSKFSAYGLGGVGILVTSEDDYTYTYYETWDSTYRTITQPGENSVNFTMAIGGGLRFKIKNRIGLYAEAQYNLVTYSGFLFFFGYGYFPIRAGLTYTFY